MLEFPEVPDLDLYLNKDNYVHESEFKKSDG